MLQLHVSFSLSPLYLASSLFEWLYVGDSELYTATRNESNVTNSLPTRWARLKLDRLSGQASWRAGPFLFFASSFRRSRSIHISTHLLGKACRLLFSYFFFVHQTSISPRDIHTASDLFYPLPDPPLTSCVFPPYILALFFLSLAFYNRSTRNCEM